MASALTDKLSRLVKTLRGQSRITEDNISDMLREVLATIPGLGKLMTGQG